MSRAKIVRAYLKAIEMRKDTLSFFAEDAVQEEFPNALSPNGAVRDLADLKAASARGQNVLQSETYEIVSLLEADDTVAAEIIWRGVMAIPLKSLKPGDTMKARFAVFFEFEGEKIRRQRNYDCFEPF
ncbi:nuclear transport factor 2 family protein [Phenylobacterium hankyongense]|uniref:Nuclear transport factor 2 family protein n=1 Tax=Phenylobacterium hankyongense TaxID=1813876 RepID=A0A328B2H7_9CAUL|nr:nuclear transport factor 2 family protein [Phenylobacterium hankyongense]RAK60641.1 nuclear transport factor 2 family protein [Phenylobacterium hankyongense]